MLKKNTLFVLIAISTLMVHAQKKKDLLIEISGLQDSILSLNDSIAIANRMVKKAEAKTALFEKENTELREANATLLKNLSSFSQISKQNTQTVNKALASLKEKEEQLKFITDDFSKNDSISIEILTQAKQTLGQEVKVGISEGDVLFSSSLDFLFGTDNTAQLSETGKTFLGKLGAILAANSDREITIEGLNITGDFTLTYQQATTVASSLMTIEGIKPESLKVLVKDGNFKEGIHIRLSSDAKDFYGKLKSAFK